MLVDTFFELGVNSGKVGGQINSFGGRAYRFLEGWLTSPQDPNRGHITAITIGFVCYTLAFSSTESPLLVADSPTRIRSVLPSSPLLGGVYH